MAEQAIVVDIWSDVVCPWCFIGKRRFETAVDRFLAAHPGATVDVRFHSFQLSPDAPLENPLSARESLSAHLGQPLAQIDAMLRHVVSLAAAEGLQFDLDAQRMTNSGQAHRLLHFAAEHGRQGELVDALFSAYFERGLHIGDPETLAQLAEAAGLDPVAARAALSSDTYARAVAQDLTLARSIGIGGVPFFVFNGRTAVSGAQDVSVFVAQLEDAVVAG